MDANPLLFLSDPQITKVLVGHSEDESSFHTRLLCHYCDYFRAQYASATQEAQENTFRLPRLGIAAFRSLQAWLYESALQSDPDRQPELKLTTDTWTMLIDLYIVAYYLDVRRLRNQVLTRIQEEYDGQWEVDERKHLPSRADVCRAWTVLPDTSHLCRWLTIAFAHRWRSWEEEAIDTEMLPVSFRTLVMNVNNRRIHERRQDEEPDFSTDLCIYHDHESRKERRKCRRMRGERFGAHRNQPTDAQQVTPESEIFSEDSEMKDNDQPEDAEGSVEGSAEPWIIKIEPEADHAGEEQEDDIDNRHVHGEDDNNNASDPDGEAVDDNVPDSSSIAAHIERGLLDQAAQRGLSTVRVPTSYLFDHPEEGDASKYQAVIEVWNVNTPEAEQEVNDSISHEDPLDENMGELEGSNSGIRWGEQAFIPDEEIKLETNGRVDSEGQRSGPRTPVDSNSSATDNVNAAAPEDVTESDEDHGSEEEYQPTTVLGPAGRGRKFGSYKTRERRPKMVGKFWSKTKAQWDRADRGQRMKWTHVGNIMEIPELREHRSPACRKCRGTTHEDDCFVYTREALRVFAGSGSMKYGKCARCYFNGRKCE